MNKCVLGALALLLGFVFSGPVKGQVTYEGCYIGNGVPVASVAANVPDIAMATIWNSQPVIFYNPQVSSVVSPPTRVFFYFHECAHHVLGHTIGMGFPLMAEQQADCWAIVTLVQSGRFGPAEVQMVQNELALHGRGDWTHLPGPQRAINLQACLTG